MTFLELCKDLHREAGISGAAPTAVANLTGELGRLVYWVASAWEELQAAKHDWLFLKGSFTFNTEAGKAEYTAVEAGIDAVTGRFRRFDTQSFRRYRTSEGLLTELPIPYLEYEVYRDDFKPGAQPGQVLAFSVTPQRKIVLVNIPDAVWTVSGEYHKGPQKLVEPNDVPDMPEEFHRLIIYMALEKYALFMSAPEVLAYSKAMAAPLRNALELDQLPDYFLDESMGL